MKNFTAFLLVVYLSSNSLGLGEIPDSRCTEKVNGEFQLTNETRNQIAALRRNVNCMQSKNIQDCQFELGLGASAVAALGAKAGANAGLKIRDPKLNFCPVALHEAPASGWIWLMSLLEPEAHAAAPSCVSQIPRLWQKQKKFLETSMRDLNNKIDLQNQIITEGKLEKLKRQAPLSWKQLTDAHPGLVEKEAQASHAYSEAVDNFFEFIRSKGGTFKMTRSDFAELSRLNKEAGRLREVWSPLSSQLRDAMNKTEIAHNLKVNNPKHTEHLDSQIEAADQNLAKLEKAKAEYARMLEVAQRPASTFDFKELVTQTKNIEKMGFSSFEASLQHQGLKSEVNVTLQTLVKDTRSAYSIGLKMDAALFEKAAKRALKPSLLGLAFGVVTIAGPTLAATTGHRDLAEGLDRGFSQLDPLSTPEMACETIRDPLFPPLPGKCDQVDLGLNSASANLLYIPEARQVELMKQSQLCSFIDLNFKSKFQGWSTQCQDQKGGRTVMKRSGMQISFRATEDIETLRSSFDHGQEFWPQVLEASACCLGSLPRPTDRECAAYGIKVAMPSQSPSSKNPTGAFGSH